jgi:hypothetical protein
LRPDADKSAIFAHTSPLTRREIPDKRIKQM